MKKCRSVDITHQNRPLVIHAMARGNGPVSYTCSPCPGTLACSSLVVRVFRDRCTPNAGKRQYLGWHFLLRHFYLVLVLISTTVERNLQSCGAEIRRLNTALDQVTVQAVAASPFPRVAVYIGYPPYRRENRSIASTRDRASSGGLCNAGCFKTFEPGYEILELGCEIFDPGYEYFRPGYNIQRPVADFEVCFGNFSRGLNIWRRASKIWNRAGGMKMSNRASKVLQQMAPHTGNGKMA